MTGREWLNIAAHLVGAMAGVLLAVGQALVYGAGLITRALVGVLVMTVYFWGRAG